jgi:hypothetical protein
MKVEMSQISAELPQHKISLKCIRNLNCMIGGSNSSVFEDSGLLVYDPLSSDEWFPMFLEKDRSICFFGVKQSKKKSWAA